MNDSDCPLLGVVIASLLVFGFIRLVQRTWPARPQARGSSNLTRLCGSLAGVAGASLVVAGYGGNLYITAGMPYCVLFVVMLLGYGLFGFPSAVRPSVVDTPPEQPVSWENGITEPIAGRNLRCKSVICYGALASVLAGILMVYIGYQSLNPRKLEVKAAYPDLAIVGEEFKVIVELVNASEREIPIVEICLAPSAESEAGFFLAGARVTRIDLAVESSFAETFPCGRISGYAVGAGETEQVTFYFEGLEPGEFSTDILIQLEGTTTVVVDLLMALAPRAAHEGPPQASCESCPRAAAGHHPLR